MTTERHTAIVRGDDVSRTTTLFYPCESSPGSGHWLDVAPGVRWIRMPLPFSPGHINLWALEDCDGWAIVDAGAHTDDTKRAWNDLLSGEDKLRITRLFVTHMHPDHVGLAHWFTEAHKATLWMAQLEFFHCRTIIADSQSPRAPDHAVEFYKRAGWGHNALTSYGERFRDFGQHVGILPSRFRRLVDGDEVIIGKHRWLVITGGGHSPEHVCLYCPSLKLLISGDQILPRISSNVSVYPVEPDADPMTDWLASLRKIKRLVPPDVLVLPSHNECFLGLHGRIDALIRSQNDAIHRLYKTLEEEPKRVVDVFGALFSRPITESDAHLMTLATGEALACLNHLLHKGKIKCTLDSNGVAWYRSLNNESVEGNGSFNGDSVVVSFAEV